MKCCCIYGKAFNLLKFLKSRVAFVARTGGERERDDRLFRNIMYTHDEQRTKLSSIGSKSFNKYLMSFACTRCTLKIHFGAVKCGVLHKEKRCKTHG